MKLFASILFCLVLTANSSIGQQAPKTHLDSVKEFFRDIHFTPERKLTKYLLDKTEFSRNDSEFFMEDCQKYKINVAGFTLVKYEYKDDGRTISNALDSVYFSPEEVAYVIKAWHHPKIKLWTNDVFPDFELVSKRTVDTFIKVFRKIQGEISREPPNVNFLYKGDDTIGIENTSVYKLDRLLRATPLWLNGHCKVSDPVFLKNDTIAIVFKYHRYLDRYSSFEMWVYKRGDKGWESFGTLVYGSIN